MSGHWFTLRLHGLFSAQMDMPGWSHSMAAIICKCSYISEHSVECNVKIYGMALGGWRRCQSPWFHAILFHPGSHCFPHFLVSFSLPSSNKLSFFLPTFFLSSYFLSFFLSSSFPFLGSNISNEWTVRNQDQRAVMICSSPHPFKLPKYVGVAVWKRNVLSGQFCV